MNTKTLAELERSMSREELIEYYRLFPPSQKSNLHNDSGVLIASYVLACLIPVIGFVMGIYWLFKSRPEHGICLMVLSCVMVPLWIRLVNI